MGNYFTTESREFGPCGHKHRTAAAALKCGHERKRKRTGASVTVAEYVYEELGFNHGQWLKVDSYSA